MIVIIVCFNLIIQFHGMLMNAIFYITANPAEFSITYSQFSIGLCRIFLDRLLLYKNLYIIAMHVYIPCTRDEHFGAIIWKKYFRL